MLTHMMYLYYGEYTATVGSWKRLTRPLSVRLIIFYESARWSVFSYFLYVNL